MSRPYGSSTVPKVEPSDSSYMPSLVEVKVGQTVGGLKELKKVSIPSSSREAILLTGMTEVRSLHYKCVTCCERKYVTYYCLHTFVDEITAT